MKILVRSAVGLGLALGPALGLLAGLAATPAGAQKMSLPTHIAFVLYEYDIKDPALFKEFAPRVRATLKDYKGEFVMREKVDSLFGGTPSNLSVISFPSVEDARKWLDSPELAKLKQERARIADVRTYLVEKLE